MKKPTRVAVIGNGRWGKNIIRTLSQLSDVEVAYVATRDYLKLIEKDDIDAVVVVTPPATHAGVALPFIKKGLPTYIEKPVTLSSKEGSRLLVASRKYRAPVFVGHIHLYNPAYETFKKMAGKAGKLQMLIGEGASNGPFRADYSALWDWAPHDLSMMLDIAGMPSTVQAWGVAVTRKNSRLHDFTLMKLSFPGGAVGVIHSSKLSPEKRRKFTLTASKHSLVYDDTLPENKVTFFEGHGPTISKAKVIENQPLLSYPKYKNDSPLTCEMKAFIETVQKKKKPKTDIESSLKVVRILEAAERSILADGKIMPVKK